MSNSLYDADARAVYEGIMSLEGSEGEALRGKIRYFFTTTIAYRRILAYIDKQYAQPNGYPPLTPDKKYGKDVIHMFYMFHKDHLKKSATYKCNLKYYEACAPKADPEENKPESRKVHHSFKSPKNYTEMVANVRKVEEVMDHKTHDTVVTIVNEREFCEGTINALTRYLNLSIGITDSMTRLEIKNLIVKFSQRPLRFSEINVIFNQVLAYYWEQVIDDFNLSPEKRADYLNLYNLNYDSEYLYKFNLDPKMENETMSNKTNYDVPAIETRIFVYGTPADEMTDDEITKRIVQIEAEIKTMDEIDNMPNPTIRKIKNMKSHIKELVKFVNDRDAKRNPGKQKKPTA